MNQERDLDRTHLRPTAPTHDDDLAPGRGSCSAQLQSPYHPVVGGLLQRKARDENGVAEGADIAIASAASSNGTSLPEPVMRKFESSLGADLSSVRVHTGSESESAAHAVGARAYTMGQDIHFGAGQYDPSSSGGEHLLAHEVAHTVQQRGGSTLRQNKLEVSSTGDRAEIEADQAADAMIRGAPVSISASSGLSRKVHREELDPSWYAKQASGAEQRANADMSKSHATMAVLGASNVGDSAAAEAEVVKIRATEENFQSALHQTVVPAELTAAYADNHHADTTISQFVTDAGVQTTSLNNFKIQYKRLMLDFERLSSMVALSGLSGDQSGANFGAELVKSQKLNAADKAAATKDTDNPDAGGAATIAIKKDELRKWQEEMTAKSSHLGEKELAITQAQHEYIAQCNEIASGLSPKSDPAAVTSLKTLQAKVENIKGYAKMVAGFASKAVGGAIGGLVTGAVDSSMGNTPSTASHTGTTSATGRVVFDKKGMPMEVTSGSVSLTPTSKTKGQDVGASVGDAAAGKVPDVVAFIAGLPFAGDINAATAAASAALEAQVAAQKAQQLATLQGKMDALRIASKAYIEDGAALERAKNNYRKVLSEMARAMDKTGGRNGKKFQTMAAFLGEAEAYLAQSKATRDIGTNEQTTAKDAAASRGKVTLATGADECKWWEVKKEKMVASDNEHWVLGKHEVHLTVGGKANSAAGAAVDDKGANAAIDAEMPSLDKSAAWVAQMRDKIKAEFNF